MGERKKPKSKRCSKPGVLADHKRIGKKLIPPLAQMVSFEVRWANETLPELLWMSLLNVYYGFARGADLALSLAKCASGVSGQKPAPLFASTTSFHFLGNEEKQAVIAVLEHSGDIATIRYALAPLVAFYPECPLAFLWGNSPPSADTQKERLDELKTIVSNLFDKTSTEATFVQANAVYIAFVTGKLTVSKNISLANFQAIQKYPDTEESRRIASAVRNAVTLFFGHDYPGGTKWAKYFWNRGLEIESCATEE